MTTGASPAPHARGTDGAADERERRLETRLAARAAEVSALRAALDMLREKLALEVKARPQVPPAALFQPAVKKKKTPKPRGHRHEHAAHTHDAGRLITEHLNGPQPPTLARISGRRSE